LRFLDDGSQRDGKISRENNNDDNNGDGNKAVTSKEFFDVLLTRSSILIESKRTKTTRRTTRLVSEPGNGIEFQNESWVLDTSDFNFWIPKKIVGKTLSS
jgi:hypothetical protein